MSAQNPAVPRRVATMTMEPVRTLPDATQPGAPRPAEYRQPCRPTGRHPRVRGAGGPRTRRFH